jgi:DNA processing protein
MCDDSMLYKIALTIIPGIGDITAKKLIAHCGSAEAVFKEKKKNLIKIPSIGKNLAESIIKADVFKQAENEIKFIEKYNIEPLFYLDNNYPRKLKNCEDCPVIIYKKGKVEFENPKVISIVGTRNATHEGKQVTERLVKQIAERNHNALIISGLAYGIDIAAHKAALNNNLETIAVLGHGLNTIYPSNHRSYAAKIVEKGALITEFRSEEPIDKSNFVKRNRIIAGLADATIVIESGIKGGALITAEIANSYNRDVFAFPGKVNDTFSKGCNWLIKTNRAALIEDIDDLEYALGWKSDTQSKKPVQLTLLPDLTDDEKKIIDLLKEKSELPIDLICYHLEYPISKVSPILLNLEFTGLIKCLPGKVYKVLI